MAKKAINTCPAVVVAAKAAVVAPVVSLEKANNRIRHSVIQTLFNAVKVILNKGTIISPSATLPEAAAKEAAVTLYPVRHPLDRMSPDFSNQDIEHFLKILTEEKAYCDLLVEKSKGTHNRLTLDASYRAQDTSLRAGLVIPFLNQQVGWRKKEAEAAAEEARLERVAKAAAEAAAKAAKRAIDIAEHEAFLASLREKHTAKAAAAKIHVPAVKRDEEKLIGAGLDALAVLNRRAGKFVTEQVMTRTEALKVTEDLSNLPRTFPDGRVLEVKLNKAGKVYRYLLKS